MGEYEIKHCCDWRHTQKLVTEMKAFGGVDAQIHIFLIFGDSWRWVIMFTSRPLLTLPGLELQPIGRPARSQSLYRLRYRRYDLTLL
jgi:hypothetical protein